MLTMSAPRPGEFTLPCLLPMRPEVKRIYIQVLVIIGIAVAAVNILPHHAAPFGCRTDLQA
jgi:hypothetical protein